MDVLRDAIRKSPETRYRIAKETGVTQGQLSRLMSGERGLSLETAQRLADHLGLELVIRSKDSTSSKK